MKTLFLLLTLTLCFSPAVCLAWQGTVLSVQDGDTMTVAPGGDTRTPVSVRLYGIDAPEYAQEGGPDSTEYLKQQCPVGKKVRVIAFSSDKYGRTVGLVLDKDKVINADMLEQGHAWVYNRYCKQKFCRKWRGLEKDAKAHSRGLWRNTEAVKPWEWRHKKK